MSCPICQAENSAAARFCNQCGSSLSTLVLPTPAATYTPKHLVERVLKSRAAMEGERKRVTVVFCDIKNSSRLAQEAGAERWHLILDRVFSILSTAVHRYEGTVNQYTGDGLMALFGAPIAHEDHAQRACHAALEMQRELHRHADELRRRDGINLSMRVGLNTGEVIVGRIGDDLRMDYTAQGPTVNLAARMEHICEPGHIYLSSYTARLVQGYFRLRSLGPMTVAGLDAPVDVHELEDVGPLATRLDRSLARGASRFLGRDHELATLTAAFERTRAGQGQAVAVIGEAGIGKSRLCHEFAAICELDGVPVYRATGVPYAKALPMFPVQTLARARLGLSRHSVAEARQLVAGALLMQDTGNSALLPNVFDFLGIAEASAGLPPDETAAASEKLLTLLSCHLLCSKTPQILLVEDLHFLDAASERFLIRLLKDLPSSPTLLLLNYRPDYGADWLGPQLAERLPISALAAEQLQEIANDWLGAHPSLEGLSANVASRAGGNPFFVEEAVLALEDTGHLTGCRGAYTLARAIQQWPVPDTVHALLAARMDRLGDPQKRLLQAASVIGQEFAPALLAELVSEQADSLDADLGSLQKAGFFQPRVAPQFGFRHPLMQEVAYSSQLESNRSRVHARLAQALEAKQPLTGPPTELALQIAHHWRRAGEPLKAGAWSLHAARWAAGRDMRTTMEQFRQARDQFDLAPLTPEVRLQRITARAGMIRISQFADADSAEILRCYQEAKQLADDCGDIASAIELMISYSNELVHQGQAGAAAKLVQDAVKLCRQHGLSTLVQRFRLAILMVCSTAGWLREGIRMVDEGGGPEWRRTAISDDNFMSRGFHGVMLSQLGQLDAAGAELHAALDYAQREDRSASWMHAFCVDHAWFVGDTEATLGHARRAYERAQTFSSPFFITLALRALGLAHCLSGEPERALEFLEQGRAQVQPGASGHQFEASFLAVLAEAYARVSRLDEALITAEAAIASGRKAGTQSWELRAWVAWFSLPVHPDRQTRAAEGLARMAELIAATGAEGYRPWLVQARAHWAGDTAAATALWQEAREAFQTIGAWGHVRRLEATRLTTTNNSAR